MLQETNLKVVIVASGSRGDIQPYVALGLNLRSRGYNVFVATENRMKGLVEEYGLEYRFIGGDPTGVLWEPKAQDVLKKGSMMKLISLTKEWDQKFDKNEILNSYIGACSGADVIIASPLTMTQTYCVSEYLQCVWIPMILGPTLPTKEFPLWALKSMICCCSCLNKWTYTVAFDMLWNSEKVFINPWRQNMLGLGPIGKRGMSGILDDLKPPILITCSPLISGPFSRIPADYPSNAHMHGFVFVPESDDSKIDPNLITFLSKDPLASTPETARPVVYLGFGSMPAPDPSELLRVAVRTCNLVRCRAVLVAGWSAIDTPECEEIIADSRALGTIFITKAVPHDWLFPKMSCIVHHCGVGTMAAALRSGVPQIPCPVMLDQPYNAATVVRLGCSPGALPFGKLTAARLAPLVTACVLPSDPIANTYKRTAKTCSEQVVRESSVAYDKYVSIIEEYIALNGVSQKKRIRSESESSNNSNSLINFGNPHSELQSSSSSSSAAVGGSGSIISNAHIKKPADNGKSSAASLLYSSSSSGKTPAFARSNTIGTMGGASAATTRSSAPNLGENKSNTFDNFNKSKFSKGAFSRGVSVGPGSMLDLDADSGTMGFGNISSKSNFNPIHSAKKESLKESLIDH